MEKYIKYIKYKTKYLELLNNYENLDSNINNISQTGGKFNYCNLPPDSKIFFGSGGSKAIIAIVKDRAYKYFPLFSSVKISKEMS